MALRTRLTTGLPFRGDRPKRPLPPSRAWHSNPCNVGLRHRTGPKRIPKLKCNKTGTQPLPDRNNEWARTPTWRYEPFRASAKGPKLPYLFGRGGGTRTHTPCQDPDFKSGASADSATPPRFLFLQVSVVLWQLGQRRRTLSLVQSPPALFRCISSIIGSPSHLSSPQTWQTLSRSSISLKRIALFPSGKLSLPVRVTALSYAARLPKGMCCTQSQAVRQGTSISLAMLLYP